jgi:hypothetical protein
MLINEWRLEGEGMLANNGLLYPNKIPSDFQGCLFKISTSHRVLHEVSHVTAFSKGYNFTPKIPFKHKTDTFLSDAIHESMKNALLGSSEVFIGGMPLLIKQCISENPHSHIMNLSMFGMFLLPGPFPVSSQFLAYSQYCSG